MGRIMVVDDMEMITTQLESFLPLMGHEVIGKAASGKEAVEVAGRVRPDLVLMDIHMPGEMDGIDASEAIKEDLDIPVVFLTGYSEDEIIDRAKNVGPLGFVKKPFDDGVLKAAIDIALYRREMEQRLRDAYEELELRVEERTAELIQTNRALEKEIVGRIRTENALRESEEKYRSLVENVDIGVYRNTGGPQGRFLFVNPALARIHGYDSVEEIMDVAISELYENPQERERFVGKLKEQGFVRNEELRLRRKDGAVIWASCTASVQYNEQSEIKWIDGVIEDITERRDMESQLAQAQKLEAIGQLAAGIAHEINTPTQYVGDNTRFLQESFADLSGLLNRYHRLLEAAKVGAVLPGLIAETEEAVEQTDIEYLQEEIPQAIEQSLDGISRVSEIVRAMREFSHPGLEGKTAIDLNRSIESTITVARNEWKYVAEMKTDFDPELPPVPCSPGELNQAILNILLNATHAISDVVGDGAGEKGLIRISTQHDEGWVEIRISDTGPGIPEEVRPRIFDPFFTTKEVGKGTGQGLAIAYNVVVDRHNGTLSLETVAGKGTTFVIRLPIEDPSR